MTISVDFAMEQGLITSTDSFVEVPGGQVFVRRWNLTTPTTKTPIILLHDSLGCVELWRDFPAILARQLSVPVVAYDRLGFGRSSERKELPSFDFIREEAEQIFPVIRDELGVADFALFGHSVGGSMAFMMGSRAVESCRAIVSESAQAFVEDRTVSGVQRAKADFQKPDHFARLKKWHGNKAQWVLDAWTETWLSPAFAAWSLASDLPFVKCPILVVHGDQDEYGSVRFPEFICRHAGGPTEMHILKGCGHVPHREQEETMIRLVSQFSAFSS